MQVASPGPSSNFSILHFVKYYYAKNHCQLPPPILHCGYNQDVGLLRLEKLDLQIAPWEDRG